MKTVFVDTSGLYAALDETDHFHQTARLLLQQAVTERWTLRTTNYVVHETWALVQARLGWEAVDVLWDDLLPLCQIEFIDPALHAAAVERCRQARQRNLSLTDCVSFEYMKRQGLTEAIADDAHFVRERIALP